ncbi:MAG TPA: NEW3 domain-containing protein [Anaerolineales bacterium]|nr:NEW3 domain-containing protein [Anaerolineales bacterium]
MQRLRYLLLITLLVGLALGAVSPVLAQEGSPGVLTISTTYPSMVIGIGETVTVSLEIYSPSAQTVLLEVSDLPKDWKAEFRGGGREIRSVYVNRDATSKVDLRLSPPDTLKAGTYQLKVIAKGNSGTAELPLELIVKDKIPPKLSFETDFPTIRGGSDFTFRFSVTLKNDGDEDITVSLSAEAPREFSVVFKSAGKDITNLPTDIKAGSSQRIDVEAVPLTSVPVGSYPINITAQGDNVNAQLTLTAEVVGQPSLSITTPDGRLSGSATLGKDNPIKLVLRNSGNSPALGVKLSASSPAGWTVTFDPEEILEVPANGEVEVTMNVKPADQAIAGDYMLTLRAQPNESATKSADFRVTVQTSTLWGIVGIALIAAAVVIVGMAVVRFGRR